MLDTWSCFRTFGLCDLVRHGSSFINTRWWDGRCHRPQMSSPRSIAWSFGIPIKNAPSLSFGNILLPQCVGQLGFLHVNTSIYTRLRWHFGGNDWHHWIYWIGLQFRVTHDYCVKFLPFWLRELGHAGKLVHMRYVTRVCFNVWVSEL